jgi:hypothetical protein
MPRFNTSFNFGANRKPRKPRKARKRTPRKRTGKRRGGASGS